ncbi:MAG: hypothetical protein R3F40_12235 [Candidatus Competibacteraceae bacterium]
MPQLLFVQAPDPDTRGFQARQKRRDHELEALRRGGVAVPPGGRGRLAKEATMDVLLDGAPALGVFAGLTDALVVENPAWRDHQFEMFALSGEPGLRVRRFAKRRRRRRRQGVGDVGRLPRFQKELRHHRKVFVLGRQPPQGMVELLIELGEPLGRAAVQIRRRQSKHRADRHAIVQEEEAGVGIVLGQRQVIGKGGPGLEQTGKGVAFERDGGPRQRPVPPHAIDELLDPSRLLEKRRGGPMGIHGASPG